MGYRREDGTWHDTSLEKVKPNEPIFALRAQDITAPEIVRQWALTAERIGVPRKKVIEALDTAKAMEDWPDRKFPD